MATWVARAVARFADEFAPRSAWRRMATAAAADASPKGKVLITSMEDARTFMSNCLVATGCPKNHADIVADNLLEADYRGHYSHGMNRLGLYIDDIKSGLCNPAATPAILKETAGTALVDGKNGMGAVVGKYCMDLAIEKAKNTGIGLVSARGSNHYGIAGKYALQALEKGFLGMSFTNTSPLMVPTRAKQGALGTNPIALGAPAVDGDDFVLDMATTAVAVGKIELARRKNQKIPEGWALNAEGKVETDPHVAFAASRMLPLGGTEINSGYKGYGLGMLVEILCAILSGSAYGPNVRRWGDHSRPANLGHAFIAIDPNAFEPGFQDRMSHLMSDLRNMEPVDPNLPVLVHGDPERIHMQKVKKDGGLIYVENQHNANKKLAEELKVPNMISKVVS